MSDVLILTEEDFIKPTCNGLTKKGIHCKNKKYESYKYCKLHYKQYSFEKPTDCPVCMEKLDNDPPLKCGHWIHKECIMKWKEDTCPICRTNIIFTDKEKRRKLKFHKKEEDITEEIIIPPQILELIEALLQGVPEFRRDGNIAELLHFNFETGSIIIGNNSDIEFDSDSEIDIEDLPDIIE